MGEVIEFLKYLGTIVLTTGTEAGFTALLQRITKRNQADTIYKKLDEAAKKWKKDHPDAWGLQQEYELTFLKDYLSQATLSDYVTGLQEYLNQRVGVWEYYKFVIDLFEESNPESIVGSEELSSAYIESYCDDNGTKRPILDYLDDWAKENSFGVMLLHGEPGHGKTTLCQKAVYDFCHQEEDGRRFQSAQGVFWFPLILTASDLAKDGELNWEKVFRWGSTKKLLPLDCCKNSVVFLDGYDELKAAAAQTNVNTLQKFWNKTREMARQYHMHVVITARTMSIKDELGRDMRNLCFAPLTEDQQDSWIRNRKSLQDYEKDFQQLRENETMRELLGIPILFRMIVNCRFKENATNVVDLYGKLFLETMARGGHPEELHKKYEELAYKIYLNDEDTAELKTDELQGEWVYSYYLKNENETCVGFFHRSFYQYFLAYYLYHKLMDVNDEESAEKFLPCLAERSLDMDMRQFIQDIAKLEEKDTSGACQAVLDCIEKTDAIVAGALVCPEKGTGEKNRFDRCNNVFVNAVSLCNRLMDGFTGSLFPRIVELLRRYDCETIELVNANLSKINLYRVNLGFADLNEAKLVKVNLKRADLGFIDFERADLSGADLGEADLREAYLREANLYETDFRGADLSGANLLGTLWLSMIFVNRETDLSDCTVFLRDKAKLQASLDRYGVTTDIDSLGIIWCDEDGKPIDENPIE